MGFAEVEYELEMGPGLEPDAESLAERVTEPETASAVSVPEPRIEEPRPSIEHEARMNEGADHLAGLTPLVRVLRDPEWIFGTSSGRRPVPCGRSVDWAVAPAEIRRYLAYWGMKCSDVLFHLKLAAEVLRKHGIKICRGEPLINFIWEEDTMSIQIVLCVDASSKQAHELTCELNAMAADLELPYRGFTFSFLDGEGDDDDGDEVDSRMRRASAEALSGKE